MVSDTTLLPPPDPLILALVQHELEEREEERARARRVESATSSEADKQRIRIATQSTSFWLRNHTKTYNPHWVEEGRPAPNEPFPDWGFFDPLLAMIEEEEISAIEKSRDMMCSWVIVGYFTLQAMLVPQREIVFQTLTDDKVEQLLDYAKCLWSQQDDWLRAAFPLKKPIDKFSKTELIFENGSAIWGIPGGKGKVRSYHPWGYFNDETSFQPEAGHCLDEALGTGARKIVLASTAGVGWFADYRADVQL